MLRTLILSGLIGALTLAPGISAYAAPHHLRTIERACGTQLRLPADACACIVARAARLKDNQQAFIAALVTRNKESMARIQSLLSAKDMTQAGMFMTKAPAQCARR